MVYTFSFFLLAALLLLVAIVLLVFGIMKKKKRLVVYSVIALVLSLGVGVYAGITLVSKSYKLVSEKILEKRNGEEIYIALFGKPIDSCLKVLHEQDQIIPKVDFAIFLHVRTCPEEMNRVLSLHDFEQKMIHANDIGGDNTPAWFQPNLLGDSVCICEYIKDEYGNVQLWYIKADTTEAYCMDVQD